MRNKTHLAPLVLVALLCLLAVACMKKEEDPAEMPEQDAPQIMEPGTQVTVEFPADGEWHESGFVALAGDSIVLNPKGPAERLGENALQFHIGRTMNNRLRPGKPVKVSRAGEISFRALQAEIEFYAHDNIQIQIQNLKK
ncbi:MAG: hypothetical protein ACLFUS_06830 [Candidatus Sumerlaeia bacterium]